LSLMTFHIQSRQLLQWMNKEKCLYLYKTHNFSFSFSFYLTYIQFKNKNFSFWVKWETIVIHLIMMIKI
jgi:hypothetical protein